MPFVWSSPIWFPVMVAVATVSIAELRLHLPEPRTTVTARQGLAGIAAVIGIYVTTALVHGARRARTMLIDVMAVITWCVLGDKASVVCGVLAAVIGPIVEIVLVEGRRVRLQRRLRRPVRRRAVACPLYFAFGVVVAMLGEIAAKRASTR